MTTMFNLASHIERRVTALEVEVKGMSDDLRSMRGSMESIGSKLDTWQQSLQTKVEERTGALAQTMDERSQARDVRQEAERRFTAGLIVTLIAGSMGAIGAFTVFIVSSLSESKIHPLQIKIAKTEERLSSTIRMTEKAMNDNQWSQVVMYKELTGGTKGDWPQQKIIFPAESLNDTGD